MWCACLLSKHFVFTLSTSPHLVAPPREPISAVFSVFSCFSSGDFPIILAWSGILAYQDTGVTGHCSWQGKKRAFLEDQMWAQCPGEPPTLRPRPGLLPPPVLKPLTPCGPRPALCSPLSSSAVGQTSLPGLPAAFLSPGVCGAATPHLTLSSGEKQARVRSSSGCREPPLPLCSLA